MYKGAGERSVESAANLVGLKVPEKPSDSDWYLLLDGILWK